MNVSLVKLRREIEELEKQLKEKVIVLKYLENLNPEPNPSSALVDGVTIAEAQPAPLSWRDLIIPKKEVLRDSRDPKVIKLDSSNSREDPKVINNVPAKALRNIKGYKNQTIREVLKGIFLRMENKPLGLHQLLGVLNSIEFNTKSKDLYTLLTVTLSSSRHPEFVRNDKNKWKLEDKFFENLNATKV